MTPKTVLLVAGSAGFSTRDVWEGYRAGLAQCGVNVIPYATFSMLRVLSHEAVGNDIIGKAHDVRNGVDAVVFIDGMHFSGERAWVPATLRDSNILTAVIKTDDPYCPIADTQRLYHLVCTNELYQKPDAEAYLPTATLAAPEISSLVGQDPESDIVFIGTLFEDRVATMLKLAEHCERRGLRFRMAGNFPADTTQFKRIPAVDFSSGTVRPDAKWRMYAASRLVLNLFRAADQAVSPSPRVFEVTALGGPALLTGVRRDEVTRIFGDSVYHFDDADELCQQVDRALANDADRRSRVAQAKAITDQAHLYRHRSETLLKLLARQRARQTTLRVTSATPDAADSPDESGATIQPGRIAEERLAWLIGCGRTGSTWLCEMLDALPEMRGWHEPYFGRLVQHLADRPDERKRPTAFFFDGNGKAGLRAIRAAFYEVARERYPGFGVETLVVKEVNTPELFAMVEELFPLSRMLFLVRDPFDVLDSYIDMRQPGSWNRASHDRASSDPKHLAAHIAGAFGRAADAFDAFEPSQKLRVRYESMIDDTAGELVRIASFLGTPANVDAIDRVVDRFRFDRHKDTGPGAFRRHGRPGVWRDSPHFTRQVREIAESILGELRDRFGYTESSPH
ncbi:glycosyltransferase family protein [Rhodopirellula sp. JC639]|uniref:glycosyltransferase family protein n=1 Tax=Stieleria mannarensis TaxID=2755585 RepID=UPI0016006DB6|nr:sulfotransferase [Rhodopirellula sp. JC639]